MGTSRKLILVKSSTAGDWLPNSCLAIAEVPKRGLDVDGLYEVLGIGVDATEEEIKTAAKKRMLESHPDVGGSSEAFEEVLEAYRTLSNPSKRATYDAKSPYDGVEVEYLAGGQPVERQRETGRPCFYKGMSDMLSDADIESIYAWQGMVLEAAYSFGAEFDIAVGISHRINRYVMQDGVAVKPATALPDEGMAKAYVLYKMIENKKNSKTKRRTKC